MSKQTNNITAEKQKQLVAIIADSALEFMQKHAKSKGMKVTKDDLLLAITNDPEGNTAKRFAELVVIGLRVIFDQAPTTSAPATAF